MFKSKQENDADAENLSVKPIVVPIDIVRRLYYSDEYWKYSGKR